MLRFLSVIKSWAPQNRRNRAPIFVGDEKVTPKKIGFGRQRIGDEEEKCLYGEATFFRACPEIEPMIPPLQGPAERGVTVG